MFRFFRRGLSRAILFWWGSSIVAFHAFGDNAFRERLVDTLEKSDLTTEQIVQHCLNRFTYGANPAGTSYSTLLQRGSDGTSDRAKTIQAVADFVTSSMDSQKFKDLKKTKIDQMLSATYPEALYGASEVDGTWRPIAAQVTSKKNELAKKQAEIETYKKDHPGKPVLKSLLEEEKTLLNERQLLSSQLSHLNQSFKIGFSMQQIAYAILDDQSLPWMLQDFWFNHFNVFGEKSLYDISDYREQIVEKMYEESFAELLLMTAQHPAMLIYLDNAKNKTVVKKGNITQYPNENYAREVMELHTLGQGPSTESTMDDYTQEDVKEAALLLSGWNLTGVDPLLPGPREFIFRSENNAGGERTVMTYKYASDLPGGKELLARLARHHRTAKHLSRKLTHRFISENGDYSRLQGELGKLFEANAPLKNIYAELFSSPELWSPAAFRSKVKQPLYYVASVLRAGAITPSTMTKSKLRSAFDQMTSMGQRPYWCVVPTGYPDENLAWASAANAISTLKYSFANGGYQGDSKSPLGRNWATAEAVSLSGFHAQSQTQSLMDLGDLQKRFLFAPHLVRLNFLNPGALQSIALVQPDRKGLQPFRMKTVLSLLVGSGDFLLH